MEFKLEVQKKFENAGWYSGRNISNLVNKIKGIDNCPDFIVDFLKEYGDLDVVTETKYVKSTLNFKTLFNGWFENFMLEEIYFVNDSKVFSLAYYEMDHAVLYVDLFGKVYLGGDNPILVSNDFKTGIEKVIMEDYTDTLEWNPETKQWVEEY